MSDPPSTLGHMFEARGSVVTGRGCVPSEPPWPEGWEFAWVVPAPAVPVPAAPAPAGSAPGSPAGSGALVPPQADAEGGEALGEWLAAQAPGPALAAVLEGIDI